MYHLINDLVSCKSPSDSKRLCYAESVTLNEMLFHGLTGSASGQFLRHINQLLSLQMETTKVFFKQVSSHSHEGKNSLGIEIPTTHSDVGKKKDEDADDVEDAEVRIFLGGC